MTLVKLGTGRKRGGEIYEKLTTKIMIGWSEIG